MFAEKDLPLPVWNSVNSKVREAEEDSGG